MISTKLLLSLLAIGCAYYYQNYSGQGLDEIEEEKKNIVEAWQSIVRVPKPNFFRICVGTNANVDLIVRGTELLSALGVQPGKAADKEQLANIEDLQEAFHHFFQNGAGAERAFVSGQQFSTVIQQAEGLTEAKWYIGGNAALMAQKIATTYHSIKVQLVGPVGPRLAALLDSRVEVPASSRVTKDEVHLIMEYSKGEKWGNSQAPVATRFITSHDIANGEMRPLATMFDSLPHFLPDLIIFSGLHLFDGQPQEFYRKKMDEIVTYLKTVPAELPVHLELASMAKTDLVKAIAEKILSRVTSLGLNEQELSFLSATMGGPHAELWENGQQPQVYQVNDILSWLMSEYGAHRHEDSRLSRIHFHCLTFHVLATLPDMWANSRVAVTMGTQVAVLQACDQQTYHLDTVDLRYPRSYHLHSGSTDVLQFDSKNPVVSFVREDVEFSLSPVLVCRHPLKTVGLGDAISSTGLIHSEYLKRGTL